MDKFIDTILAHNNTLVKKLGSNVYVDTAKNLDRLEYESYKLVSLYKASKDEMISAMTGGIGSKFTICDGEKSHTFVGNVYLIVKK